MIQIDMQMPKSCDECPFRNDVDWCLLIANVPAWQDEIENECHDRRSEHCPLIDATPPVD